MCSGCGLDRSEDSSLASPQRLPCPACACTAVTYSRTLVATVTVTASLASILRPAAQERDWRVRWTQLQQRLARVTGPRSGARSADTLHAAEQDLFEFFVSAYHLKDALIEDRVATKDVVESVITSNPSLALLADLANMDKHRRLTKPPRSGDIPVIDGPAGEASGTSATWRLLVTIRHGGRQIDALRFADVVVTEWRTTLLSWGLST